MSEKEGRFCHNCGALQEEEELRPIPGFPRYCATRSGRIYGPRGWMKGATNKRGYRYVSLRHSDGGKANINVHILVAQAFHGLRPEGLLVRHLNGDASDNRASNLSYGTHKENTDDRIRHGRDFRGSKSPSAKLSETDVREIRLSRLTDRNLALRYGVSHATISNVRTGRTWRHVK